MATPSHSSRQAEAATDSCDTAAAIPNPYRGIRLLGCHRYHVANAMIEAGPRLGIERCGKINASNSGSESCTGIGVVAGFCTVVLIMQWPHRRNGEVTWRSELLQRLQEVRGNCKTRNQLVAKMSRVIMPEGMFFPGQRYTQSDGLRWGPVDGERFATGERDHDATAT